MFERRDVRHSYHLYSEGSIIFNHLYHPLSVVENSRGEIKEALFHLIHEMKDTSGPRAFALRSIFTHNFFWFHQAF